MYLKQNKRIREDGRVNTKKVSRQIIRWFRTCVISSSWEIECGSELPGRWGLGRHKVLIFSRVYTQDPHEPYLSQHGIQGEEMCLCPCVYLRRCLKHWPVRWTARKGVRKEGFLYSRLRWDLGLLQTSGQRIRLCWAGQLARAGQVAGRPPPSPQSLAQLSPL